MKIFVVVYCFVVLQATCRTPITLQKKFHHRQFDTTSTVVRDKSKFFPNFCKNDILNLP